MTTTTSPADEARAAMLRAACFALRLDTLDARHSDRMDFHEVAVWTLKAVLESAYEAGLRAGKFPGGNN